MFLSHTGPNIRVEHIGAANGFDRAQHERIRTDLQRGRIGLAQNRLPTATTVEDVRPGDVADLTGPPDPEWVRLGKRALEAGRQANCPDMEEGDGKAEAE